MAPRPHHPPMAKPKNVELSNGVLIPIIYEDACTLAIDKPAGWMCAPTSWQSTGRNLQAALESSVNHRDYWAKSRNLNFLRFVHRLDADTSGVLLLAKSAGALKALSELFQTRAVEKSYLAVVAGVVAEDEWSCDLRIGPVKGRRGVMKVDPAVEGEAYTEFRTLQRRNGFSLIEAKPLTGRTHQIRVHLQAGGHPVLNDPLYGNDDAEKQMLALRATEVSYVEPFRKKRVHIRARVAKFIGAHGFEVKQAEKIRRSD
jgi:RluA family pseudouridine synthase